MNVSHSGTPLEDQLRMNVSHCKVHCFISTSAHILELQRWMLMMVSSVEVQNRSLRTASDFGLVMDEKERNVFELKNNVATVVALR